MKLRNTLSLSPSAAMSRRMISRRLSDQVKTFSLAAMSVDQSATLHVHDDGIGQRSDDLHVKGALRFVLIGK